MTEQNASVRITHDETARRFVLTEDSREAGFAEYREHAGARNFHHTVVYPEFRGRGLSKPLIRAALDDTREAGLKVIPQCSAVARFIAADDGYRDLVY